MGRATYLVISWLPVVVAIPLLVKFRGLRGLWLLLALLGTVAVAVIVRSVVPDPTRLNSRIPPPNVAKYRDIRDGKDWLNPQVLVGSESMVVESASFSGGRKTVTVDELRPVLISLPVTAWPYGRIVRASDPGLRRGDGKDEEAIRRNHQAVERVLKSLDIRADWLPSA